MSGLLNGLGRNVLALAAASFFTDVASEMIFPLLPIFLTGVLKGSPALLGLIEGAAAGLSSLLRIASGRLADRTRRPKALVLAGYGLSVAARPFFALAAAGWHVLAIRLADRVGKGIRLAPRDAILAASCTPETRGRAFGFQKAMDHLGAAVGPLIATALLLRGWALRDLFLLTALPAALSLASIAIFVRNPDAPGSAAPASLSLAPFDARFRRFLACAALFTLGAGADAFLILRARDCGVADEYIPLFWSGVNVSRMLLSLPGGILSDRLDRRRVILAGWLIHVAVFCGLAFTGSLGVFLLLLALYGVHHALTEGVLRAFVTDLVPAEQRGTAFGLYHCATGLASIPGGILFGLLWKNAGAPAAFLGAAGVAFAAALGLARLAPRKT